MRPDVIDQQFDFIHSGSKNKDGGEAKRGPGRPRRYPSSQEENESKAIEVNIVNIQSQSSVVEQKEKKKVELGEVLELAVQSMSATMTEDEAENSKQAQQQSQSEEKPRVVRRPVPEKHQTYDLSAEDLDSDDFEWKLDNEEDSIGVSHSPVVKKKKTSASSSNVIVPTVSFA